MDEEITKLCSEPIATSHYIASNISPEDCALLEECEKRYKKV